jgi:branched-chain amino acid aminotransferase
MRAWLNGALLDDADAAAVAVTDHGFTVGDGVFEAIKVVDSKPFAMQRHLDRLRVSAKGLGLVPPSEDDLVAAIDAVLAAEPTALGRLRITLTGGPAPLGSGRGHTQTPTLAVVVTSLEPAAESTIAVTVPWPRNERSAIAGLKTTSYAENVVALAYAAERGATEAIFANTVGNLCEGTGSNVFYVVGGQIRTPTLASGCLAGVTRALILEWCADAGMDIVEIDEPCGVLDEADEIFLASTTRDAQPVVRLDERVLEIGPVTLGVEGVWADREGGA